MAHHTDYIIVYISDIGHSIWCVQISLFFNNLFLPRNNLNLSILQSAFVLSGLPYHFQMEKEKENGHGQAYAPNGAMGQK